MTKLALWAQTSLLVLATACSGRSGANLGARGDASVGDDGSQTGDTGGADTGGDDGSSSDAASPGDATSCGPGFTLCNGYCVNAGNDILNCGMCGKTCTDTNPYCNNGLCTTAPCTGGNCGSTEFCCGTECCTVGQLCCDVPSNIATFPKCTTPVNGTCPVGCPLCP
jgi:hypothetical protein